VIASLQRGAVSDVVSLLQGVVFTMLTLHPSG